MKKHLIGTALLAALLLLTPGCDWIRASLGKPTSADLAALRVQKAQREQAVKDSLAAAVAAAAAYARTIAGQVSTDADTVAEAPVLKRYHAVAGAFKDPAGAQLYADKLRENGFKVRCLNFKSGLKVVCVGGSDTLEVALRDASAIKKLGFSGSDPWIYDTRQKLHKEI